MHKRLMQELATLKILFYYLKSVWRILLKEVDKCNNVLNDLCRIVSDLPILHFPCNVSSKKSHDLSKLELLFYKNSDLPKVSDFIKTQTYKTFQRHGGSFIILQKQYYYCYNSLPTSHSMEKIFKIQGSCYKYKK